MPSFSAENLRQAAEALDQLTQLHADSQVDLSGPILTVDEKMFGALHLTGEEDPTYELWIDGPT